MIGWLAVAALAFPPIDQVDFGPGCDPIPEGGDRWWAEGRPGHEMALVEVDTLTHPRALCNDGTAATYYVRAGDESGRWVIHLQGGGVCVDQASCLARWCFTADSDYSAEMMSSAYSHPTLLTGGILDPDPVRNRFSGWNHVFVHYCSSDVFLGQAADVDLEDPADPAHSYRIHFLGREILDAVLDELEDGRPELTAHGLPSLRDADQVLLTGTTSGAVGVIHNLDRVAARLQATNPGVDVRGVVDSASYPAADTAAGAPYTGTWNPDSLDRYQELAAPSALYASERDQSCAAFHAGGEDWWCDERMHVLTSHVSTPFFAYSDQLDGENPLCQGDPACAPGLRDQFRSFDDIADPSIPREGPPDYPLSAPLPGYALSRCANQGFAHAVLTWRDSVGFLDRKIPVGAYVPGQSTWVSLHDALWSWVSGDEGPTTVVREADPGAPACPNPPPSAPGGITATYDAASNAVTVSWDHPTFATSTTVSWSAGEEVTPDSASFPPVVGAETFTDVAPTGHRRCYAVRGANAEGEGPLSAAACVDLPGEDEPPGETGGRDQPQACGCGSPYASGWLAGAGVLFLATSRRRGR